MTTATARAAAGAATTSPIEPLHAASRPDRGAARARAAELFADHGRMVDGLCRGLLRDPVESEDAAQQTFLSAYRALLGGAVPREPGAWLATIARNECLGRIRERMRRPLPVEALAEEASGLPDPLTEAIRRADIAALWAAVTELPLQQRDALVMREFAGLRYDELAVALGVTEPAVESLLFRARRQVRTALTPVSAASALPFALRDAIGRLLAGAAPAGAAVKIGAATVGVAMVAGGAVVVDPALTRHYLRPDPQTNRPAPARHAVARAGAARPAEVVQVPVAAVSRPLVRTVAQARRATIAFAVPTLTRHEDGEATAPPGGTKDGGGSGEAEHTAALSTHGQQTGGDERHVAAEDVSHGNAGSGDGHSGDVQPSDGGGHDAGGGSGQGQGGDGGSGAGSGGQDGQGDGGSGVPGNGGD